MKATNPILNIDSFRRYREVGWAHILTSPSTSELPRCIGSAVEGLGIFLVWGPAADRVHCTSSAKWVKHNLHKITHPDSSEDESAHPSMTRVPYISELLQSGGDKTTSRTNQGNPTLPQSGGVDAAPQSEGHHKETKLPDTGQGFDFACLPERDHIAGNVAAPAEAPRHWDISSSLDQRNVITNPRTRRPSAKVAYTVFTAVLAPPPYLKP
jgi:hypothetical protein